MFAAVWLYDVAAKHKKAFIAAYDVDGVWARLFSESDDYLGTELLKKENGFLVIDRWTTKRAYEAFLKANRTRYETLNLEFAPLRARETLIGRFES
ncbi:MAG: hypothetical protein AB7J28_07075 [Hyphomonadaceae bacterium]